MCLSPQEQLSWISRESSAASGTPLFMLLVSSATQWAPLKLCLYPSVLDCACVCAKSLSPVRLCETQWTAARQAPLFMGLSRQEYCSGLPCPPLQGIFPVQGSNLRLLHLLCLQAGWGSHFRIYEESSNTEDILKAKTYARHFSYIMPSNHNTSLVFKLGNYSF